MNGLHPTLWRTCRILANQRRLDCLRAVLTNPGSTVEDVASIANIPESQASLCLRALQARGLIHPQRLSRWVKYTPIPDESVPIAAPVLEAMRRSLLVNKLGNQEIMHTLTAFTHPRRLVILRAIHRSGTPQSTGSLSTLTKISIPALLRHLTKLEQRYLVLKTNGCWHLAQTPSALAQAMCTLIAYGVD